MNYCILKLQFSTYVKKFEDPYQKMASIVLKLYSLKILQSFLFIRMAQQTTSISTLEF